VTYYATDDGSLFDYHTGEYLREATSAELHASREAALYDGGAGAIGESDLSFPARETQ